MNDIKVKLEDVCERGSSNLAQKDLENLTGDYPVYGAGGYIKDIDFYHQENEYIAVVKDGAGIGRTVFLPGKSSVIGTLQYLVPKDNIVPKYLYYAVTSMKLEKYYTGATIPHIYFKDYKKEILPLPNKNIQLEIVSILEKAEKIISYRKQQLEDLDNLIKSRFVEMFGDPISNPNNYVYKSIGEVIKSITAGWSANGEARIKQQHEKAVLKVSAVTQGFFKPDEYKVIDVNEPIKKYVFPQKGDLLFSRANTREMVGATAIIEQDYPDLFLPDKLWKILFENTVNVYYMKFILSTPAIRAEFSAQSTGTSGSMYNVSMDKFKGIGIPIPPIELQIQFATFVHQVDKLKVEMQQSLNESQLLFDSLMQKYFG
jgi:type I restriction enzyme S subunit